MQIEKIRLVGEPVLREKAKEVPKVTKRIKTLLDKMAMTMYHAEGVGLAAPQIGVSERIVVIDVGEGLIELINPEIVSAEGMEVNTEGCLSIPGVLGEVSRASHVVVKALNREGKPIKIEGKGMLARALQHEIDHLDGILFIDKALTLTKKG